jgi:hypothetical protein
MIPLPPKRFQRPDHPKYDPIRPFPWFARLEERRAKIGHLALAYHEWKVEGKMQLEAATNWGVDERELRDFGAFVEGRKLVTPDVGRNFQAILDDAYGHYLAANGKYHIRHFIETIAPFFGIKGRHVVEMWEADPAFYPTGYKPFCEKCGENYAMVNHKDKGWVCHRTHEL